MADLMVRDHMEVKTRTEMEVAMGVEEADMDSKMGEGMADNQTLVDLEAREVVEVENETETLQSLLATLAMLIKPQLETSSDRRV